MYGGCLLCPLYPLLTWSMLTIPGITEIKYPLDKYVFSLILNLGTTVLLRCRIWWKCKLLSISLKIKWYLPPFLSAEVHIESRKEVKIMTWTTKMHYFIFWLVNYHFQIPSIISTIVCKYELKYRMQWSVTIYNINNYKEETPHEITKVKKFGSA